MLNFASLRGLFTRSNLAIKRDCFAIARNDGIINVSDDFLISLPL